MIISFGLIVGLIAAVPILIFWDSALAHAVLAGYVAAAVVFVAWDLRPGEGSHFARVVRPVALAAAIPALWILVQVLPLPIPALLHPTWLSARDTLKDSLLGSISIDVGASLVALTAYLTAIGVVIASAAVSIDRQRAEWTLIALTAVSTLVAVLLVVYRAIGSFFVGPSAIDVPGESLEAINALAVLITLAFTIQSFERFETRHPQIDLSLLSFSRPFIYGLIGFVITTASILLFGPRPIIFATGCGLATMVWVLIMRRVGLGAWSGAVAAVVGVGAAAFIVLSQWASGSAGFSLRFAAARSSALVATTERLLAQATWSGSGAGSYAALLPIYRTADDVSLRSLAPTTASNALIELGWLMFGVSLLLAAVVFVALLAGALRRGRDSLYATAAAAAVVLAAVEAFCDASLLTFSVSTMMAVVIGLGIAQSVSRSVQ